MIYSYNTLSYIGTALTQSPAEQDLDAKGITIVAGR
jgi:hypothetical protein